MKIEMFPGCCGGAIISGFGCTNNRLGYAMGELCPGLDESDEEWVERAATWIKDELVRIKASAFEFEKQGRHAPMTWGFFQAVLNEEQVEHWHDILVALGFRVVAKDVINFRYRSKMTIYLFVMHGEDNG